MTIKENISFTDYMSGIGLPDCSGLAVNWKKLNDVTISDMVSSSIFFFFWSCFVSLVRFSYWSKFHVKIINGSWVMSIFFYKGLTRNLEIENIPVWVFSNIWRLRRVRNTKFGTDVSTKLLLNAAKCQGYSFYRFWVITVN